MSYLVLARKWRPQSFDDLTGQEHVSRILKNTIAQNKVAHAYIFSGPRGVGKTTTARILSKALNCAEGPTPTPCGKCQSCLSVVEGSSIDVSEIDGASNTGVDNIRDLRERVRYAPSESKYKVYIIDEAHMLSTAAFNALLKTLEEPPPHVVFVLATTEPRKILPTVLSRCQHLPFRRITSHAIKERLKFITKNEAIVISDSALEMVSRAADGSMRDSLTILDQLSSFSDNILDSDVMNMLGITDIRSISDMTSALIEGDRSRIIMTIAVLIDTGIDIKTYTRDMLQFLRNLLIATIVDTTENILDLNEEEDAAIKELKSITNQEHVALLLSEFIKAEPSIRSSLYPRVAFELTLIRLSFLSHFKDVNEAIKSLGDVPKQIRPAASRLDKFSPKVQPVEDIPENKTPPAPQPDTPRSEAKQNVSLAEAWGNMITHIEENDYPFASKLKECVASFSDKTIALSLNGGASMHEEFIREKLNALKEQIHELSGINPEIKIEIAKAKGKSKRDLIEDAKQNKIVSTGLELFEGLVSDVIPNKKGGDNV
ncbi:MAG: DNA polymerase III subunit gamma/tau [Nitrospirae bacterium]|nr:MAG: DNA polymerase III subunit gamma/tau [Nitrospirota bacterium]